MNCKIIFSLAIITSLLISCKEDFDIVDTYKDIPIVYGLLTLNDTAHYIRVERAFVDALQDAAVIAQNPDSLYYDNIIVQLVRKTTGQAFTLQEVDGNLEGYPRESGPFADAPNTLYKIRSSEINLVENEAYKVVIKHSGSEDILTEASTFVVGAYIPDPFYPGDSVNFNSNTVTFAWRSNEDIATFYELFLVMHYDETDPGNPASTIPKTLVWTLDKNIPRDNVSGNPAVQSTYKVLGTDFFKFFEQQLDPPVAGVNRVFKTFDMVVNAGGPEIREYITTGQANTGLTGTLSIPTYTNLTLGYGLLSSRYQLVKSNIKIHKATRDSLAGGQYTDDLNFQ